MLSVTDISFQDSMIPNVREIIAIAHRNDYVESYIQITGVVFHYSTILIVSFNSVAFLCRLVT